MDTDNPREWFNALMDYGAHLKAVHGNVNARSTHYKKQTTFKGSNREVRGAILRTLLSAEKMTTYSLSKKLRKDESAIKHALQTLEKEELVKKSNKSYKLV